MNKSVLFLTTANLAMKPRLIKEIQAARQIFSDITVVSFLIGNWTDKVHKETAGQLGIKSVELTATRSSFIPWFLASIIQKICMYIWPVVKKNVLFSAFASNKRTVLLWFWYLQNKKKYDLVNGRNTATLYVLFLFLRKRKTHISFDIEDYHPGEKITWTNARNEKIRRELLMKKVLPLCSVVSHAGIPIGEKSRMLLNTENRKWINLNNTFPSSEFKFIEPKNNRKIRFVWYSVDISRNRGLEQFIPVLAKYKNRVGLSLIGTRLNEFYINFLSRYNDLIEYIEPMTQQKLHNHICNYDVGLAIEINETDQNKQLAISNKIYAYSQAGLFVLSTGTIGQKSFMDSNPWAGVLTSDNPLEIKSRLEFIIENIDEIRQNKKQRFLKAKAIAWENESEKLVSAWRSLL